MNMIELKKEINQKYKSSIKIDEISPHNEKSQSTTSFILEKNKAIRS